METVTLTHPLIFASQRNMPQLAPVTRSRVSGIVFRSAVRLQKKKTLYFSRKRACYGIRAATKTLLLSPHGVLSPSYGDSMSPNDAFMRFNMVRNA